MAPQLSIVQFLNKLKPETAFEVQQTQCDLGFVPNGTLASVASQWQCDVQRFSLLVTEDTLLTRARWDAKIDGMTLSSTGIPWSSNMGDVKTTTQGEGDSGIIIDEEFELVWWGGAFMKVRRNMQYCTHSVTCTRPTALIIMEV